MPDISVDTSSQGYRRHLARFNALKAYYGPILTLYHRATEDEQRAWRQRDPLLKELLDFAKKVERQKDVE